MKYISTTELRTKSSELVADLKSGRPVTLIHRSEVIGVVTPVTSEGVTSSKLLNRFLTLAASSKKTTPAQRKQVYREHLEQKYGKNIS